MNHFRYQSWHMAGRVLTPTSSPLVMGIVNLTPDSFSDGGRFYHDNRIDFDLLLSQVRIFEEAGAAILDLGAESTAPGTLSVDSQTQISRLVPAIEFLVRETKLPLSVDTTSASVAQAACRAGAIIINDISGGTFDPDMPRVAVEFHAGVCLGHIQGVPQTMQNAPYYTHVLQEVMAELQKVRDRFLNAGLDPNAICLDPGIGFGKSFEHNITLLDNVHRFHELGQPVLIGHSRKRFLKEYIRRYALLGPGALARAITDSLHCPSFSDEMLEEVGLTQKVLSASVISVELLDAMTELVSRCLASKGVDFLRIHTIQKRMEPASVFRKKRESE